MFGHVYMLSRFSWVWLFATLWTVALQAPLTWNFPGKNTRLGCHGQYTALTYSFPDLEPVCCSSSNCCFLTCIQMSQEAGPVVWYSHLFQNFPQFIVIHTVKGFGIVNKAEVDVFLELSCFFCDPVDVGNLISGSSAFSKTSLNIWNFVVHVLLKQFWALLY